MSISFYYDIEKFKLKESRKIRSVISRILNDFRKRAGLISIVFTNDEELQKINEEFLKHNYLTDIITFDYHRKRIIDGEIYISVERVKENAEINKVPVKEEIKRVIFHGILHLCGFKDETEEEEMKMHEMEDIYLDIYEGK